MVMGAPPPPPWTVALKQRKKCHTWKSNLIMKIWRREPQIQLSDQLNNSLPLPTGERTLDKSKLETV
jgi:hypothetical protein